MRYNWSQTQRHIIFGYGIDCESLRHSFGVEDVSVISSYRIGIWLTHVCYSFKVLNIHTSREIELKWTKQSLIILSDSVIFVCLVVSRYFQLKSCLHNETILICFARHNFRWNSNCFTLQFELNIFIHFIMQIWAGTDTVVNCCSKV